MTQINGTWNCIIEIEGCLGLLVGTQIPHPWAFEYGHWAEMEKVKTLIFITKLLPSPNTNVTFQFCTVQLFLNHLYKNFRSWLMMDELLSPKAPSSHYPLRQSLLMMDLKCFPSGSSAVNCAEGSKDLVWHEISRPKLFSDNSFSILREIGEEIPVTGVLMVKMQHCQPAKVLQLWWSWPWKFRCRTHVLYNTYMQDILVCGV